MIAQCSICSLHHKRRTKQVIPPDSHEQSSPLTLFSCGSLRILLALSVSWASLGSRKSLSSYPLYSESLSAVTLTISAALPFSPSPSISSAMRSLWRESLSESPCSLGRYLAQKRGRLDVKSIQAFVLRLSPSLEYGCRSAAWL